jgi:hypothetical protein
MIKSVGFRKPDKFLAFQKVAAKATLLLILEAVFEG